MAQIITSRGGGGGGGGASYTAGNGIDITNNEISVDESVVQTTDNLVTNLNNPDDTHYPSAKAVSDAITSSGGGDMLKSVYDPDNVSANAFDYDNFINTPDLSQYAQVSDIPTDNSQLANGCGYITNSALSGYAKTCDIPTDNCQLANSCGYTTCTGTVVASDLTAYAKSCTLCTVATSGKYCDLSGTPTIPTDNCQLANSCGYTTCTGTLVASDLNGYAQTCSLCAVATSGKYCDLSGTPTIPTDNCQLANGCGYTTCTGTITGICMNGASCGTSGVVDLGTVGGITKIFKLASTSDLTNAQAAYDRYASGGNPIIKYSSSYLTLAYLTSAFMRFTRVAQISQTAYWTYTETVEFTLSSGTVTAIADNIVEIKASTSAPTSGGANVITLVY